MRIVVVLPAPFGPRNPYSSPRSTSRSSPSTASIVVVALAQSADGQGRHGSVGRACLQRAASTGPARSQVWSPRSTAIADPSGPANGRSCAASGGDGTVESRATIRPSAVPNIRVGDAGTRCAPCPRATSTSSAASAPYGSGRDTSARRRVEREHRRVDRVEGDTGEARGDRARRRRRRSGPGPAAAGASRRRSPRTDPTSESGRQRASAPVRRRRGRRPSVALHGDGGAGATPRISARARPTGSKGVPTTAAARRRGIPSSSRNGDRSRCTARSSAESHHHARVAVHHQVLLARRQQVRDPEAVRGVPHLPPLVARSARQHGRRARAPAEAAQAARAPRGRASCARRPEIVTGRDAASIVEASSSSAATAGRTGSSSARTTVTPSPRRPPRARQDRRDRSAAGPGRSPAILTLYHRRRVHGGPDDATVTEPSLAGVDGGSEHRARHEHGAPGAAGRREPRDQQVPAELLVEYARPCVSIDRKSANAPASESHSPTRPVTNIAYSTWSATRVLSNGRRSQYHADRMPSPVNSTTIAISNTFIDDPPSRGPAPPRPRRRWSARSRSYHSPTARKDGGVSIACTSSASAARAADGGRSRDRRRDDDPAAAAARAHRTAASAVAPVARPSSTTTTVRPATASGGRRPAVSRGPAGDLGLLAPRPRSQVGRVDLQRAAGARVPDLHARRDGADRELGVAGRADLPA